MGSGLGQQPATAAPLNMSNATTRVRIVFPPRQQFSMIREFIRCQHHFFVGVAKRRKTKRYLLHCDIGVALGGGSGRRKFLGRAFADFPGSPSARPCLLSPFQAQITHVFCSLAEGERERGPMVAASLRDPIACPLVVMRSSHFARQGGSVRCCTATASARAVSPIFNSLRAGFPTGSLSAKGGRYSEPVDARMRVQDD